MWKLLKRLKNSAGIIVFILMLLVVQAVCDLSLPDYTSNIVNVGIQQGGVENAAFKVVSQQTLESLLLFTTSSEEEIVRSHYSLSNGSEDVPQYTLQTKDKAQIEIISEILGRAMMSFSVVQQQGEQFLTYYLMMPKENQEAVLLQIHEQLAEIPETMINQMAVTMVTQEYNTLGIDVEKLQNNYILRTGAIMVGIALLSMCMTIMVGFLAARVAAGLGRDLRQQVFEKVISFSNVELEKFSTASLITRSTNDIQQVVMFTTMLLRMLLYAPILGLGGVIKVLGTNMEMAWIIGVAVVAILVVVILLFTFAMPKFKVLQQLVDRVNLVMRETLTGMLVIRAFSTEHYEEKRFDKANDDLMRTNRFVNRVMSGMMPIMMLIMNGISILIVWNGAKSIDAGVMQVGDMMAFIQYTMQIIMSFLMITMASVMLPRAIVAMQRIDEVLTTEVSIVSPTAPQILNTETTSNSVVFKDVSFSYPDAEEEVLQHISFEAKAGETTAFIGSTGSGKSTLINLIPRFFDVTRGEICINGINIKDMSLNDLRDQIGLVPQKGVLFSGDIESNLKYGKADATQEQIEQAATIAQAMEFIEAKPDKFKTPIAQGGSNVSGGQKQRLSIARAIAKDPSIYVFDDSFSALDLKTDAILRRALKEVTKDKVTLIVAQRISTILNAEQIIVLDEGRIVGKGTHKQLLADCEVYRQIASSQLSKEELDHE